MAIYRLAGNQLKPFRPKTADVGLYEQEVEDLVWNFPEEVVGEPLFLVARQPTLPDGSRPDVVALDSSSRVVVIEVKRDFDRGQLAQALEYAGWAQRTSLDEVAQFYQRQYGTDFFEAWREFGEAGVLEILNPRPRMILVSQNLHPRTRAAVEFMMSSGMSLDVRGVTIHVGEGQDLIVEVVGVDVPAGVAPSVEGATRRRYYGVRLADLVSAELLTEGERLRWHRAKTGETHEATLLPGGAGLEIDGVEYPSPSAASDAVSHRSTDGWDVWEVERGGGWVKLHELRVRYLGEEQADQA